MSSWELAKVMVLSEKDFAFVGIGSLYAPPFLSGTILFRLHDPGTTLVVTHADPCEVLNVNAAVDICVVAVTSPKALRIYFEEHSSAKTLESMLSTQFREVSFPQSGAVFVDLAAVRLRIETYLLSCSGNLIRAYPHLPVLKLGIPDSAFEVVGPLAITKWSPGSQLRCWKLSVINTRSGIEYAIDGTSDWTVAAFDTDSGAPQPVQVLLQRKT